jgi:hypothetical protein
MKKLLPLLLLLPLGCTVESSTEPAETTETTETTATLHRVECGCALESVGHCGNYVEVDGEFVEIAGDLGLGKMEWCSKTGLSANVEGKMVGDKFVATSLEMAK